jgi:hypothetical protein
MFGILARALLIVAGAIAGWLVTDDAVNFSAVQMTVALVLFGLLVLVVAFWPWPGARKPDSRSR